MLQNAELWMTTNEPSLLPKQRGAFIEHRQLQGVEFTCTSLECQGKDVSISCVEGKAPKDAKFDASWTEIACSHCGTRYLIEWSSSEGDGSTAVQRIEKRKI